MDLRHRQSTLGSTASLTQATPNRLMADGFAFTHTNASTIFFPSRRIRDRFVANGAK